MNNLHTAISALLCSLCVGCIVPTPKHTPIGYGRGEIDTKTLRMMALGSTSREQVLLKLGEPDAAWKDEQYFLYRWFTVRGYAVTMGTAGEIGGEGHNLIVEFDHDGLVKDYGDIRQWAVRLYHRAVLKPLDSSPIDIPIKHWHEGFTNPSADALLTLGKGSVEFTEATNASHNFRISPEKIIQLTLFSQKNDPIWVAGDLACTIHFSTPPLGSYPPYMAPGRYLTLAQREKAQKIRLKVGVLSLPTLIEYLRQTAPNLVIKTAAPTWYEDDFGVF